MMLKLAKSKSLGGLSHMLKELTRRNSQAVAATAAAATNTSEAVKPKVKDTITTYTNGKISFATTVADFTLISERVGDSLLKHALNTPNKVAFAFPHQNVHLTFLELNQRVKSAMESMHSLGLRKGDRVAFALPNCQELLINFVAASQLGLISVILNPAYQSVEFEYMLNKTGSKALFMFDTFKTLNHIDMINKMCPELASSLPGELQAKKLPSLRHVIVLNSPFADKNISSKSYKGTWQYDQLSQVKSQHMNIEPSYVDIEDPCVILFTSGTTGKPKGAVLSHHGLNNSCHLSFLAYGYPDALKNSCVPIPFFHVYGLSTGILDTLLQGDTKVIPFYFPETVTTMKAIQDYSCTSVRGAPTQFIDLINHPDRTKYDLSSFETMIVAGSTVPPDLLKKATEVLKIKSFAVGYGMTEMSSCHTLVTYSDRYLQPYHRTFESVGRPIPFSETKVVDPVTGQIVPLNTPGELMVRGPHVIKEYWDEQEKNKEMFDKYGYLKTGDICTMDEQGYIFFKSRSKDLIIRGGANLYPAEIESYLRTHPDVLDAQVFGVPDERMGEEVCAWIKRRVDSQLTEASVKAFCKGNISHFKIPRYIKFVDSFPINANQKVVKSVMRDQAIKELKL